MSELILKLKMLWLYRGHFREWREDVWKWDGSERMCCDGRMCCCSGVDFRSWWEHLWEMRRPRP